MKDMYVMNFIEDLESVNGRDHGMIEKWIDHNMALPSYSRRLGNFSQSLSHYHFWKIFICFLNPVSFPHYVEDTLPFYFSPPPPNIAHRSLQRQSSLFIFLIHSKFEQDKL